MVVGVGGAQRGGVAAVAHGASCRGPRAARPGRRRRARRARAAAGRSRPGSRRSVIGLRTDGTVSPSAPTCTTGSSPSSSAKATPSLTVLIGPAGHAGADEQRRNHSMRVRVARPLDEQRAQRVAVDGAVLVAGEARVVGQLGDAEHAAQRAELPVVARGDDDVAVGRRQRRRTGTGSGASCPCGYGVTPAATTALAWLTSPDSAEDSRLTSTCCPSPVAVAVAQRGEHADRGVQPGHHVEDRDARAVRRSVGVAGQAHQAGDGLHDEVVAGQRRARRRSRSR